MRFPFASWTAQPHRSPRSRRQAAVRCESLEERCVLSSAHPAVTAPFQVQWSFPANGQTLGNGPGFIAVSMNQTIDWTTATHQNVQLAHQNADGSWSVLSTMIWVNPSNNTVVIAPTAIQPNGHYVVALYGGLHSTTGASIGAPVFESFFINDTWGTSNPVTVFPPDNGSTGVVVADQSRALDPSSVNTSTVQVFALNPDGSQGAQVPVTVVYDPNIPSIELALQVGLKAGTYEFVEHGVRDASGNVLATTVTENFTIAADQVPSGPDTLQYTPIAVAATYPVDGGVSTASPIDEVTFNQAPNPTTINTNTIQLVRWLPAQGHWSNPLPISVTDNGLHQAMIIPTAGLQYGNYLIAVNGVKDLLGRTMTAPQYFHYTFTTNGFYPVDSRLFGSFPANAQTFNGTPPAILVFLRKYAGDLPSSINTSTVQLLPWLGTHTGNPLPIGVAYNPWPGEIVISPFFAIGDGTYVIEVNGVTDLAGNVQHGSYSSWFTITGTGRPQST